MYAAEVQAAIAFLTEQLEKYQGAFRATALSLSFYGLQRMSNTDSNPGSDSGSNPASGSSSSSSNNSTSGNAVTALIDALLTKMQVDNAALSPREIGNCLYGIQNMFIHLQPAWKPTIRRWLTQLRQLEDDDAEKDISVGKDEEEEEVVGEEVDGNSGRSKLSEKGRIRKAFGSRGQLLPLYQCLCIVACEGLRLPLLYR